MTLLCYHPSWGGASRHQVWWGSGLGGDAWARRGGSAPRAVAPSPARGPQNPAGTGAKGPYYTLFP